MSSVFGVNGNACAKAAGPHSIIPNTKLNKMILVQQRLGGVFIIGLKTNQNQLI